MEMDRAPALIDLDKCQKLTSDILNGLSRIQPANNKDLDEYQTLFQDIQNLINMVSPSLTVMVENAHLFDPHADLPKHNGFRSIIKISHTIIGYLLDELSAHSAAFAKKSNFSVQRSSLHALQDEYRLLASFYCVIKIGEKICLRQLQSEDKYSLFLSDDDPLHQFIDNVDVFFDSIYYKRHLGFQFDESAKFAITTISLAFVSFGDACSKSDKKINRLISSLFLSPNYSTNHTKRAERIKELLENANVNFVKSFWNLMDDVKIDNLYRIIGPQVSIVKNFMVDTDLKESHDFLKKITELTAEDKEKAEKSTDKIDKVKSHENLRKINSEYSKHNNHNNNLTKVQVDIKSSSNNVSDEPDTKLINGVNVYYLRRTKKPRSKHFNDANFSFEKEFQNVFQDQNNASQTTLDQNDTLKQASPDKYGDSKSDDEGATALSDHLIFHMHGGGFVAQTPKSHMSYLRVWANLTGAPIVSVDYSLSPEERFPTALIQCYQVYKYVIENSKSEFGTTARKVIFVGDSAGGNLVYALALKLAMREHNPDYLPVPCAIFAAYPALLAKPVLSPSRLLAICDILLNIKILFSCLSSYLPESVNDNNYYKTKYYRRMQKNQTGDDSLVMSTFLLKRRGGLSKSKSVTELSLLTAIRKNSLRQTQNREPLKHDKNCSSMPLNQRFKSLDDMMLVCDTKDHEQNKQRFRFLDGIHWNDYRQKLSESAFVSPLMAPDSHLLLLKKHKVKQYLIPTNTDSLLDDSIAMAKKLMDLNIPVNVHVAEGLPHGFLQFGTLCKKSAKLVKLIGEEMTRILYN